MKARATVPLALLIACTVLTLPALANARPCVAVHGRTVAVMCLGGLASDVNPLVVSHDEGATFTQVAEHVRSATVTASEVVYALSDSEPPSVIRFAERTESHALPLESALEIRSVGETLLVLGLRTHNGEAQSAVVTSEDAGVTWQLLGSVPVWATGTLFHVAPGATHPEVELIVQYGLSCWGIVQVRRFAFDGRAFQSAYLIEDDACANHNEACSNLDFLAVGAHGSAFGFRHAPEELPETLPLVAMRPVEGHQATDLRVRVDETLLVADNGLITLAIAGQRLVRIEGTHHTVLDPNAPFGATDLTVDERGRAWVITTESDLPYRTHLHRFSRRRGWEELGISTARP